MSPVLYPKKGKKHHILHSLSELIYDHVWYLSLSGISPMLEDKESLLFAITDKENCFPHSHMDKEIDLSSAYCYFWKASINTFSYCIVLQNIQTSKNTQYLKYPVLNCEAGKAVLQKPQIQQGFQDLARIIPLGAHFVGEALLRLNGSCHAWELHKPAKCLRAWEDPPCPESTPLQKQLGAWALLLHSCCQE